MSNLILARQIANLPKILGQASTRGCGFRRAALLAPVLAALLPGVGHAQNLYWDLTSGSGNWDDSNWNTSPSANGTGNQPWISGDTAYFSATSVDTSSNTVTLESPQTAAGINFQTGTNLITGSTLTLTGGGAITVSASPVEGIIASPIAGSAGLTKSGSGELDLRGTNTFTGNLTNKAGILTLDNNQAGGGGSIVFIPISSVVLNSSLSSITLTNNILLASGNASIEVDAGANNTLVLGGAVSGSHAWNVNGTGKVVLSADNTFSGALTILQGTLVAESAFALGSQNSHNVVNVSSGATLAFEGGNDFPANIGGVSLNGFGVGGGAALDNISGDNILDGAVTLTASSSIGSEADILDVNQPVGGGSYNLTIVGSGEVDLTGTPNNYGNTFISQGGTLGVYGSANVGNGTVIVSNGATLLGNGSAPGGVVVSGTIQPDGGLGVIPNTLGTASETWNSGGSYAWTIDDATGTPGADPGYATLNISGTLAINATPANPFVIHLSSLDPNLYVPGVADNFDNTQVYTWTLATASGGISGFSAADFVIDASGFQNDLGNGAFVLQQSGNNLNVLFVQKPQITAGPASQTIDQCGNVTFSATVTGTAPLQCQWFFNSTPIPGANSTTYTTNDIAFANAGTYSVTVSNLSGTTVSASAILTVTNPPPVIVANTITVDLNSGNYTLTPADVAALVAGSYDHCGNAFIASTNVSPGSFDCSGVGTTNVTVTMMDVSNQTSTASAQVIVQDVTPPALVINPLSVTLDASGNYTLTASNIASLVAGSSVACCPIASTNVGQTSFNFYNVGNNSVSVTLKDEHGVSATKTATIVVNAPTNSPAAVYVDASYPASGGSPVTFPNNHGTGTYYIGYNAFPTIQAGVNGVAAGGTVNVAAGTYVENVNISQPLTLLGPNAGKAGNDPTRGSEAVVLPAVNQPSDGQPGCVLFNLQSSNVTIDGLGFNGQNPALGSGYSMGGVQVNAAFAVANSAEGDSGTFAQIDHLTIQNNVLTNFAWQGIYLQVNQDTDHSWNYIRSNRFDNMWEGVQTYALISDITDNVFNNVGRGLSRHVVYAAGDPGFVPIIANNTVNMGPETTWQAGVSRVVGIWVNYQRGAADPLFVTNNTVNFPNPVSPGHLAYGFWALTVDGGRTVTYQNDTVNGSNNCTIGFLGSGIDGGANVTVANSALNGAAYGALLANSDATYPDAGAGESVTFSNMTVSSCSTGLCAMALSGAQGQPVQINDVGGLTVTDCVVGASVLGGKNAALTVLQSSFNGNAIGIAVDTGTALIQNNDLTGNTVAAISVTNNAIVDAGDCSGSDLTGLATGSGANGSSAGGNNLSYGFGGAAPWAIQVQGPSTVLAEGDNFGATAPTNITAAFYDPGLTIKYSQNPAVIVAPPSATVTCDGDPLVTQPGTNYSSFFSLGGYYSGSPTGPQGNPVLVSFSDNPTPLIGNGAITRTYTIQDSCQTYTTTQIITVLNTNPPVFTSMPANIIQANDLNTCGATISITPPTATGTCDGPDGHSTVTVTGLDSLGNHYANATSYSFNYPKGLATITWTAADVYGNQTNYTQTVTVNDTQPPVVTAWPPNQTLDVNGQCEVAVPDLTTGITASDNCGSVILSQVPPANTWVSLGTTNVVLTVTDGSGNLTDHTVVLTVIDTTPAPTATFVDAAYAALPAGTIVTWPYTNGAVDGTHYVGCDAFATIQGGIDRVAAGGTVNVAAGTYPEAIVIPDSLTLLGAQAGQNANTRFAAFATGPNGPKANPSVESIITAATNAPTSALNDSIHIMADNVTINGFVFDGNNPSLPQVGAVQIGGINTDSRRAIETENAAGSFFSANAVLVENNVIQNYAQRGVELINPSDTSPESTGSLITGNVIGNYGLDGIALWYNAYSDITSNTLTMAPDSESGIWMQDSGNPGTGVTPTIIDWSHNTVTVCQDASYGGGGGIWVNLFHTSASTINIHDNAVNAAAGVTGDDDYTYGIYLTSVEGSTTINLTNNIVGASGGQFARGIALWNLTTTTPTTVSGGAVSNSLIGVSLSYYDENFQGAGSSLAAKLSAVNLSGTPVGALADATDAGSFTVQMEICGNSVISGCTTGISVLGSNAFATIHDNTASISGNGIGIAVDTGKALIENNDLTGNTVAAISVTNNAIVDAGNCTGNNVTGLGISTGNNNLTGYGFDNAAPWAIENFNSASTAVLAENNIFGAGAGQNIASAIQNASGTVEYSQTSAVVSPPTNVTVVCASQVPAGAVNFSQFLAQGGAYSGNMATVGFSDSTNLTGNGIITRTYTVTGPCGDSTNCAQIITVSDTNPPTFGIVPSDMVVDTDPGECGKSNVTWTVTATDDCGPASVVSIPPSGSTFGKGTTTVTNIATDPDSGNTATNTFTVTVIATNPPVFITPATNQTIVANMDTAKAPIPDLTSQVTASDPCGGVTLTQTPLAGTVVGLGNTSVTVWATDQSGNSNSCMATVTVIYTNAPVWNPVTETNAVVTTLDAKDPYATGTPTATDPDAPVSITYNDDRSALTNCDTTGVIYRTWTATDASGNASTYVQTVTVVDNTNATYFTSVPANQVVTNDPGQCSAVVAFAPTAVNLGYQQDFSDPNYVSGSYLNQPSTDWNDYDSHVSRVPSGTNGIVSPNGVAYAVIDSTVAPAQGGNTGAFSRLGGYSSVFGSGYQVSQDIYINLQDPAVINATAASGYAWDLSVAANEQNGNNLRDFIFHAAAYDSNAVVVAASNNSSDSAANRGGDLRTGNFASITNSGWYTFKWNFRDANDVLAVDLSVLDTNGVVLFTQTLSDPSDVISTLVGGHRYLWFTFIAANQLPIGATTFERNVPVNSAPASGSGFPVGTTTVTNTATDQCGNSTNATFTVTVNDTSTTTIAASTNSSIYGNSVTFTATVSSCTLPSTGTVTFMDGTTILGTATNSAGQADFTTASLAAGSHAITAVYSGDTYYTPSTSPVLTFTVNQATPTVTTAPAATEITYGQTLASSSLSGGVGSVPGTFAFTTPATAPLAGTASQPVTFTPSDTNNYTTATTAASVTVNPATPGLSGLAATAITYGNPLSASTISGTATNSYNNATVQGTFAYAVPTNVPDSGQAAQSVIFTPTDASDYTTASGSVTLTVNQATSTWTYSGGTTFIYNSTAQGPKALENGSTGQQTTVFVGTNLQGAAYLDANAPTNAGVYYESNTVAADNNFNGATNTQVFVIDQATNDILLTSSEPASTYGDDVVFSAAVQTNLNQGALATAGDATGSVVFSVDGTVVATEPLNNGVATYDAGKTLAVPSHIITVTYAGDNNYSNNVTASPLTQAVNKAEATISVTPYSLTYDGQPHTAGASAVGVFGEPLAGLDVSGTTHTLAGTYNNDPWTFTDATGNYNNTSGTVNDLITQATSTWTYSGGTTFIYNSTAQGPTAAAHGSTGPQTTVFVGTNLLGAAYSDPNAPTNAGVYYESNTVAADNNFNGATNTQVFVIDQATNDILLTSSEPASTYGDDVVFSAAVQTNLNQGALATAGDATGSVVFSVDGTVVATEPLNNGVATYDAGKTLAVPSHIITVTYAGDNNYSNNVTASPLTQAVNKAEATISVTPYSLTYDGQPHTADASAVGVFGEPLAGLDVSGTTHTLAGTYNNDPWTFTDATGNYNNTSGTVNDLITQASSTWTYSGGTTFIYNSTAQGPKALENGSTGQQTTVFVGTNLQGAAYLDANAPTNAGVYYESNTVAADNNFNGATNTHVFVIDQATNDILLTSGEPASTYGDDVVFSAAVQTNFNQGALATAGDATGSVVFSVDGTVVATEPLNNGVATYDAGKTLAVPSHIITVTYAGDNNYSNNVTASPLTQTVNKAEATISVTPYSLTYDGQPHTAGASAVGVFGEPLAGLDVSGTTHTFAGTYNNDPWTFTDATGNYNNTSGTVNDLITPAGLTITANSTSKVYGTTLTFAGTEFTTSGLVTGDTVTNVTLTSSGAPSSALEGTYDIVPSLAAGTGLSNYTITYVNSTLTVQATAPTVISLTPVSQTNNATTTASFAVTVTGPSSFTNYQWVKITATATNLLTDGGNISGSTSNVLTITNVLAADQAEYAVTITNAAGSVTTNATLVVNDPVIFGQPLNATQALGGNVSFSVNAAGTAPLSYQWLQNNAVLLGQTASNLVLNGIADSASGSYTVIVSNSVGEITSSNATLTITHPPVFISQPATAVVNQGGNVTFSVRMSGTSPFSYEWLKDNTPVTGFIPVVGNVFTLNNVTSNNDGYYSVLVTNADGQATSSNALLTVIVPPAFTSQPAGVTTNAGATVTFSVSNSGSPSTYQWFKNGTNALMDGGNVLGSASPLLTLTNVLGADSATYDVVISNSAGVVTSSNATLTVIDPIITSQPVSVTTNLGAPASFTVGAYGTAPQYQWLLNGTNIPGATSATYAITAVADADAGSYSVVVSNAYGMVTSAPTATLAVIDPPVITQNPASLTVNLTSNASFTVGYTGTAPAFQWYKGNSPITGATTATYDLPSVADADAGTYTVVLSNAAGTATSAPASLTVIDPPFITQAPTNLTVNATSNATFTVTYTGTPPTFQWYTNGSILSGATGQTLTLLNVSQANAALYTVVLSNPAGTVTSTPPALLTVIDPPFITQDPASLTVNLTSNASFTVSYTGSTPAFQWYKGTSPIAGATTATYDLPSVADADAGTYTVVLSNAAGTATSAPPATLTVIDPAIITSQPASTTNDAGTTATFTVGYTGTAPAFQWFKNGTNALADGGNIQGANTATLTVSNVFGIDGGEYSVAISNAAALAVSSNATLVVLDPVITAQPVGITNIDGSTVNFAVTVVGTAPLAYQWYVDGYQLDDETNSILTLGDIADSDEGDYTVVITNVYGSVTSSPAELVTVPPLIITQPASQVAFVPEAVSFSVNVDGATPFTYQWLKNGTNIPGATSRIYLIPSAALSDAGTYEVSVSNPDGTQLSDPATLTVYSSPILSLMLTGPGQPPVVNLNGAPGVGYILEESTNLLNWIPVDTNLSPFTFTDMNANFNGSPERFYRAKYQP